MILKFSGLYGSTINLDGNGEIQGYEFLEPPIGVPIREGWICDIGVDVS